MFSVVEFAEESVSVVRTEWFTPRKHNINNVQQNNLVTNTLQDEFPIRLPLADVNDVHLLEKHLEKKSNSTSLVTDFKITILAKI